MSQKVTLIDNIRLRGYRLTPQRRLVLDILEESRDHLDADSLYRLAKARDARISLATVYRSLTLMKEVGLVQEHRLGEDHGHFETAKVHPHFHFTCLKCRRVIEFTAPEMLGLVRKVCTGKGLQVLDMNVDFTGYCSQCREVEITL